MITKTMKRAKYAIVTITKTMKSFLNTKQDNSKSLNDYRKKFKQAKDNLEKKQVYKYWIHSSKIQAGSKTQKGDDEKKRIKSEVQGRWVAFTFIANSNQRKMDQL